jgi:UDP-N-acetylmuramate--alanine ligase
MATAAPGPSQARRPAPPWPRVHFVGVGGYSMSGLAAALAALGVPTSGSDVAASARTARAAAAGVRVRIGHDAEAVRELPPGSAVVYSTDVPPDNPELAAARARGLALLHRSEVLDWFLRHAGPTAAAVTGTHGKSTTTSLVGLACREAGLDPTVFVGADVPGLEGGNFRLGTGPVVAEADESDGSFLRYSPDVAVVTSCEPEHLEHYGGDFRRVCAAFGAFLRRLRPGGLAVLCADDPQVRQLGSGAGGEVLWYGLGPGAELTAADVRREQGRTRFVVLERGSPLVEVSLRLPGRHNVANALAALAAARRLGCDPAAAARALGAFPGAARRLEVLARAGGIAVADDYAHHPTEVAATLQAARELAEGRVLAVFQPHRFRRTAQLWDAFGPAFRGADRLWLTEIYGPPGEPPLPGVDGAALAEAVRRSSGVPVVFCPDLELLPELCLAEARPGDLILVMGAGSITRVAHAIAERLRGTPAAP